MYLYLVWNKDQNYCYYYYYYYREYSCSIMTEKGQGKTPGVCFIEVSIKRESPVNIIYTHKISLFPEFFIGLKI